jgi:hypothetical protein
MHVHGFWHGLQRCALMTNVRNTRPISIGEAVIKTDNPGFSMMRNSNTIILQFELNFHFRISIDALEVRKFTSDTPYLHCMRRLNPTKALGD